MKSIDALVAEFSKSLTRNSRKARVVASNLANVDTPGYRALEVTFAREMERAARLARTSRRHLQSRSATPRGVTQEAPVNRARPDGNTVDPDREIAQLARVSGRYNGTTLMLRQRLSLLRYAVTDGKSAR